MRVLISALALLCALGQTSFGRLGTGIPKGAGGGGGGTQFSYLGSFTLPTTLAGSANGFQFAGVGVGKSRGFAFNPDGNGGCGSLYVAGANNENHGFTVAEVAIPGTCSEPALVQGDNPTGGSTNVASLPRTRFLVQTSSGLANFYDITGGYINTPDPFFGNGGSATGPALGGLGVSGGVLYGSVYSAFGCCVDEGDGRGVQGQAIEMFKHGLDLSVNSFDGWYTVEDPVIAALGAGLAAGNIAGVFGNIPASLQGAFGGTMLAGLSGPSIVSRTSFGASAAVFTAASIGGGTPSRNGSIASSSTVTAKAVVDYPDGHLTLGAWGNGIVNTFVDWNELTGGLILEDGFLYVPTSYGVGHAISGATGLDVVTHWYGPATHDWTLNGIQVYQDAGLNTGPPCATTGTPPAGCTIAPGYFYGYDPLTPEYSGHGTESWPPAYRVLKYLQSDLLAVIGNTKSPWDVTPVAAIDLPMPFDPRSFGAIAVAYDAAHRNFYLFQPSSQDTSPSEARPMIHAYHIN